MSIDTLVLRTEEKRENDKVSSVFPSKLISSISFYKKKIEK